MGHRKDDWTPTREDWFKLVANVDSEILKLHNRIEKLEKEKE